MPLLRSKNSRRTQAWLLFATLALLVGSILWGLKIAAGARTSFGASATWSVVTGRIIESRVVDRGGLKRYCPFVRYAYELGGTVFHASRIALLPGDPSMCSGNQEAAARLLESYPVDRQVPVYYNPAEPGRSVLAVRELTWLEAFPESAYIAIFVLFAIVVRQAIAMQRSNFSD